MSDEAPPEGKTEDTKPRRGRPKGFKTMATRLREAKEDIKAELQSSNVQSSPVVREGGKIISGSLNPGGRPRGLAAYIRAEFSDLPKIAGEIGRGERKATREQVTMLKDMIDRGWGRAPETHLVGAMTEEQRDTVAGLTRDQLLGLLDGTAAESDAVTVEGTVITSSTDYSTVSESKDEDPK